MGRRATGRTSRTGGGCAGKPGPQAEGGVCWGFGRGYCCSITQLLDWQKKQGKGSAYQHKMWLLLLCFLISVLKHRYSSFNSNKTWLCITVVVSTSVLFLCPHPAKMCLRCRAFIWPNYVWKLLGKKKMGNSTFLQSNLEICRGQYRTDLRRGK